MYSARLIVLAVIVLVCGCSDDRDSTPVPEFSIASLPGVYSGEFPCDGCPGIPTTLWLRADGRFFLQQRYLGGEAKDVVDTYSLGRWDWVGDDRAIVLTGEGPERTFVRVDRDALVMRTDSELEHRVSRDPGSPEFSAVVRMAGIMRIRGDSAVFTECLTGFEAPVSKSDDYARFRRQFRSVVARGEPAYVELEGRFAWSDDGTLKTLTIVRFVTVKPDGVC